MAKYFNYKIMRVLAFCVLIITSCSTTDNVKIIGTAYPLKGSAIVSTKDTTIYYLEDISEWEKDVLYKKVVVIGSGIDTIIDNANYDTIKHIPNQINVPQYVKCQLIIKNPIYKRYWSFKRLK